MNLNALFAEQANILAGVPLDMAGTPGLTTGWISLKNYHRATVVLLCAAGGAETPTITLQQATAIAGTGAKNAPVISRVHRKEHASALEGVGTWTLVEQAAAATFAGTQAVQAAYAIDVRPEDLDTDNNFDCIQATVADVGATAKLGSLFVILWGPRFLPPLSPKAD